MNAHLQIMTLAAPLIGTLTTPQGALFSEIIDAVQEEINAQIRPDAESLQSNDSLVLAAVLLSVSTMKKLMDADISDFTAGTLKVTLRDDHSVYAQMADRLLAPWRKADFAFRGVSG